MRILFLFVAVLTSLGGPSLAYAGFPLKTFTVCKGEFKSSCPGKPTIHMSCEKSETPVIERECTVTENGKERIRAYTKSEISSQDGNKCGYTVWKADCSSE